MHLLVNRDKESDQSQNKDGRRFSNTFWRFMSFYMRLPICSGRLTKAILSRMTENTFTILYGSQTGQAKAIAEEIYEQAEGYDLKAKLLCLSSTDKKVSIQTAMRRGKQSF